MNKPAVLCLWMACAGMLSAQTDMRGHWSGSIDTPVGPLAMEVDLDKTTTGWIGSASIPAQGASGVPLDGVTFADGKAAFRLKGGPGDPAWSGTLSADGKTLDGTFTQGGQSLPLKFSRTGEAKVDLPKASPAVAPAFVGTFEGTVNFGAPLRLRLTISNGKNGSEATIVSLDQGDAQIPVSEITQQGTKLTLIVKAVSGDYSGEMNAQGTEIKGTWTQFGMSTDLVLTKK
jgi:hypothetical protein